ncbi:enamine deaminase RidA (YjgF/YER057c/UK114 family) [Crossiella equi]|uniref:Enamine deaminase RidA (YjgF/YER057c/UK114 family) n=1 Tax=Crossiella equi TaxID=130796 RepID=A0ABS5ALU9_9PSEU|nr:RidA family protein [Crossiella equi]MBP2477257.1 enamine deaminase RidA (YjgF/YER057c/UK114 family) [Crossiella equi]
MQTTLDNPPGAPAPFASYSQVARIELGTGALLVLSGQIAVDENGAPMANRDMRAQAENVFAGIGALLAAHGAALTDIINIRTYLTDMADLPAYGEVRRRLFPAPAPTSTTVQVAKLFRPEALLEVEVVATVPAR